jgi:hypothetical protein
MTAIERNPLMNNLDERKKSFTNKEWGLSIPHCINKLSEAGFYLTEYNNFIKCFHCSGILRKWDKDENPLYIIHIVIFWKTKKGKHLSTNCKNSKKMVNNILD